MKTFEDAIRTAVETKGLDIAKCALGEADENYEGGDDTFSYPKSDDSGYHIISYYQLIFGTPFIDVLAGEKTCLNCGLKFVKESKTVAKRFISCRINENLREDYTPCDRYKLSHDADYHLTQMLKIRMDTNKLKEYVVNLLEDEGWSG